MMGLINEDERKCLADRLRGVQEAIKRRMDYEKQHPDEPSKFIEDGKWGDVRKRLVESLKTEKDKKALEEDTYLSPDCLIGMTIQQAEK